MGNDRTTNGVLAALRAGRAFVSRDVTGPQLFVEHDGEYLRARVVGARGAVAMALSERGVEYASAVASDDWSERVRVPERFQFLRAQVLDERGQMLALSNAVFPTAL